MGSAYSYFGLKDPGEVRKATTQKSNNDPYSFFGLNKPQPVSRPTPGQPEFYEDAPVDFSKYLTSSHTASAPVVQPPKPSTWDQVKAGDIKGLMGELGLGLSQGLANTGAAKQNVDIANMLTKNTLPGMADMGRQQLAGIQANQEYLKANPAESLPAILGKEIPMLPLWMAGEAGVGLVGKQLAKLSPRIASTVEKVGSRLPSFVKGGLTDAGAYGSVVAPTQNIQEGGSFRDLIEKEKQLPGILLGGVAARGAFKGIGKALEGTKGILKPLGVPAAPVNPVVPARPPMLSPVRQDILSPRIELPTDGPLNRFGVKAGQGVQGTDVPLGARMEMPKVGDSGVQGISGMDHKMAAKGSGIKLESNLTSDKPVIPLKSPRVEPVGEKRLSFPDTVARGEITDPKLAEQIGKTELNYGNITNKDTLEVARKFINEDREAALNLVLSDAPATAESNAVSQLLIKEANDAGKFDQAISLIEKTSQKSRTQGQAIQALSMWGKLSPEGVLRYAENTIAKVRNPKQVAELNASTKRLTEEMGKANSEVAETIAKEVESGLGPKLKEKPAKQAKETIIKAPKLSDDIIKKLDEVEAAARARLANRKGNLNSLPVDVLADYILIGSTKLAKGAVNLTTWSAEMIKEFGEGIKDELPKLFEKTKLGYDDFAKANGLAKLEIEIAPEQQLADRIKASLASGEPKEKDAVKILVDTLYKVARESPLPTKEKMPTDPLTFVSDAIKNKDQYREVWNKAKDIINKKFEDDPEALALLDDYIGKGIKRTFPENQLNRSVSQGLKEMDVSVGDIVRQHYSVNSQVRDDLVTQLTQKSGLSGEDAEILEKYVRDRMKDLTKVKKEQILAQIFKPRVVRPRKEISEKIIELSNLGGFQNQNYKMLVGEKLGIPVLDEGTARSIVEQSKKIQIMEDGEEKRVATSKMLQMIADKVPSTFGEKMLGIQRISLLLNPKSMVRNTISNAAFGVVDNVSNVLATPLDKAIGKFTGKRTTTLPSITGQLKSSVKGLKEVASDATGGLKAKDFEGKTFGEKVKLIREGLDNPVDTYEGRTQYDLPSKKIFQGDRLDQRVLNKLDNMTKIGLQAGDRPFYQASKQDSLHQQMKLAGVSEPTDDMIVQAIKTANERTYQDVNTMTEAFKIAQQSLNKAGSYLGFGSKDVGLGNIVMPFVKTPSSLLARSVDYSPVGLNKAIREALNIKNGTFDQKAFVDSISRSVTGTALIMVGYDLAKKGIITGRGDKDKDVASFEKSLGKNPYSYKVGDKYFEYSFLQPSSLSIAIGADMAINGKDRKHAENVVIDAVKSGGETLFKQSLLQGLTRFMGGYSPVEGISSTLANAPTMLIPTAAKQVSQVIDPVTRSTYAEGSGDTAINRIKARTPGLTKSLEPQIDTFGNVKKNFQGDNSLFNIFLNPSGATKFNPNRVQREILRIYESTGSKDIFPKLAPKSFTEKKVEITLTPQEITRFQQIMGKKAEKNLNAVVGRGGSDKAKAEAMKEAIANAYEYARKDILKNRPK